jgi:hypothetical protein
LFDDKRTAEIKEIFTRYFGGDSNIDIIASIAGGLFNHCSMEKLAPIIMELLSDDPLVDRITEIYAQGNTLWTTLQNGNEVIRGVTDGVRTEIFDIIENALALAGYTILDGDRDCIIIRHTANDTDYRIIVEEEPC